MKSKRTASKMFSILCAIALASSMVPLPALADESQGQNEASQVITNEDLTGETSLTKVTAGEAEDLSAAQYKQNLATASASGSASPSTRLAGEDRYETMAKIAQEGFADDSCDVAILAKGGGFPDALASSALAGVSDAPIILTDTNTLSSEAKKELSRLGVKTVYVLGGTNAVSDEVFAQVEDMGMSVERVAGETRQDTSVKIYERMLDQNAAFDTVIVASGLNFADALSISPYAYAKETPILLTGSDGLLTEQELAAIKANSNISNVVVAGGTSVVNDGVIEQLGGQSAYNFTRLGGAHRYETSQLIAEWELENGVGASTIAVANGRNFPDALTGAALAGADDGVVLLVAGDQERNGSENLNTVDGFVANHDVWVWSAHVLGGTNAVPEWAKAYLDDVLNIGEGQAAFQDGASVVENATYEVAADGEAVMIDASSLPAGVDAGDVVALMPTEENLGGAAVKIDSMGEGSAIASTVSVDQVYSDIDVAGFTSDITDVVPADGVQIEWAETAVTEASEVHTLALELGEETAESSIAVNSKGKNSAELGAIKAKIPVDKGSIAVEITPTVVYKFKGSLFNLRNADCYLGMRFKTSYDFTLASASLELSDTQTYDLKLGQLKFATKVPGLYVALTLYATIDAGGSMTLKCSSKASAGCGYEQGEWAFDHSSSSSFDGCELSGSVSTGLDGSLSLDALSQPLADVSVGLGLEGNGTATVRNTGMSCLDLAIGPFFKIAFGAHSLMSDFGLTYKKTFDLPGHTNVHFENAEYVKKCTWGKQNPGGGGLEDNDGDPYKGFTGEKNANDIEDNGYGTTPLFVSNLTIGGLNILAEPFNIPAGKAYKFLRGSSSYGMTYYFDYTAGSLILLTRYNEQGEFDSEELISKGQAGSYSAINWNSKPFKIEVLCGRATVTKMDKMNPFSSPEIYYEISDCEMIDYPMAISQTRLDLNVGQEETLSVSVGLDGWDWTGETAWAVEDSAVANVSNEGAVTACGPGQTLVTASWSNGLNRQCLVTVK